jgi:Family of unknown function (DUF6000)
VGSLTPDEPELMTTIRRYVIGTGSAARYMKLLNGNFMEMDTAQRGPFLQELAASARKVSDHDLAVLLGADWRPRLTASWLIALDRRQQFRQQIGDLLLARELTYAGQGHCVALARFATAADAELLAAYLAQPDRRYDQPWALGALLYLDEQLGTSRTAPFLPDGGPGQQWSDSAQTPAELREMIRQLCSAADEAMNPG